MMLKSYSFIRSAFTLVVAALFATACDPDRNGNPDDLPDDSDPQVARVSPASGYVLARRGETVQIVFNLHDNEQLTTWEAKEKWISATGIVYSPETRIAGQYAAISTTNSLRTIDYKVPTGSGIQLYSTIEISAYATDNKGKVAKDILKINVIPDKDDTTTDYEMQAYSDDTLWSVTTGDNYVFDLIGHRVGNSQNLPLPNQYIREASTPPAISWILVSPIQAAMDSTIVTTDDQHFNYDEATYETTWQAFVTSSRIGNRSDPLSQGDIVILKMPVLPHFAILRVNSTEGAAGCGCMRFDYKYSYP